jgi:alpha-amylase/alpha-mannosidase (GH57 family)
MPHPDRYVVIHGHFYQPPRENPWIEEIELQDSAAPYHDWNERIQAECYGPNAASRIVAGSGGIIDIFNNYRKLSWNFGPTLLAWLERRAPETYARIQAADAETHGGLAQAYNHVILPLASRRDRETQIRWGIRDFEHRFGRRADGMWLPECAVSNEVLEQLVDEGIRFTVLSPHSCARVRQLDRGDWVRGGVDPRRPYRIELAGGRSIVVFFYDGVIAQKIAFGEALKDRDTLVGAIEAGFDPERKGPQLVNVATDGETFGHHRAFGDMVLAAALERIGREQPFTLTTYSAYLERFPPEHAAEIVSPSSWSCAHGVERWRADCGCTTPTQPGWHQRWRKPLREAIDDLAARLAGLFEREGRAIFADPWAARNEYIAVVLDRSRERADALLDRHATEPLDAARRSRALRLLEIGRQAMLMQTSCGWFFDELSRPEGVQVLKYAMRAIQLARDLTGEDLESEFAGRLAAAPANVGGDGGHVLDTLVRPAVTTLGGVVAHYAISSLFEDYPANGRLYSYRFHAACGARRSRGQTQLAVGRVRIESEITRESLDASYGLVHFGGHDFRCTSGPLAPEDHAAAKRELLAAFDDGSMTDVVRTLDRWLTGRDYGLGDLFLDERRKIVGVLLGEVIERYQDRYEIIFDENRALLRFLVGHDTPVPQVLRVAAELTLARRLAGQIETLEHDGALAAQQRREIADLATEARRLKLELPRDAWAAVFERRVEQAVAALSQPGCDPGDALQAVTTYVELARDLGLVIPVWQAQNRLWAFVQSGAVRALDPPKREALLRLTELLGFDRGAISARSS